MAEITLQLNTSEQQAALLLEMLTERMRQTPSGLPDRAAWVDLARQVADLVAAQLGHDEAPPGGQNGRSI